MKAAVRLQDKVYTGHLCSIIVPLISTPQSLVTINNIDAVVLGAALEPHSIDAGSTCVPHAGIVTTASTKVTMGGIPAARLGDDADLGKIITGSPNVFIGG